MGILIGVLEQGFIYGIMALGVYITYKILDFPDLTTDGSFPAGASRNGSSSYRRNEPIYFNTHIFCSRYDYRCFDGYHTR